jgi:hypothetical protein
MTRARRLVFSIILGLTASMASASYIYNPTSLPGVGTCPDGSISWYSDPQQGQVIRTQVSEVDTAVKNSERCEFVGGGGGALQDGMTIYVGWKSRVQTPTSSSWNGIYQAKCHGTHVADQPLVFNISNGRLTLENHEDINGQETSRTVWSTTLPGSSTWFSILMKIRYSESRTVGYVQLWYNGVLQTLQNGQNIHYGQTWDGSENNMHWGIYRRSSINGTEIHYVYKPRIATTFAEADPLGGANPTPTPRPTATPGPGPTSTPAPTATPGGGGFSGYYRLMARHSSKAVVVQGASTANSGDVVQWTYGGTATNDEWELVNLGTGYYKVVNRNSGKVLNVAGVSTANGANVDQWSWANANQQQWQITDLGNGYHRFTARHSGKVLNVAGVSTADGANIDQWSWANVNQQQFQLVSVP